MMLYAGRIIEVFVPDPNALLASVALVEANYSYGWIN